MRRVVEMMHNFVQSTPPDWHFLSDWKPGLAQKKREHLLDELGNKDVVLLMRIFRALQLGAFLPRKKLSV